MAHFENEMLYGLGQILERIEHKIGHIERRLTIIESQIYNLQPHPTGVEIIFYNDKGETMADLVLGKGESKVAVLHYTTGGVDSGSVPASDNPSFSTDSPDSLSLSKNEDGSVTITNTNSGDGDVTANLVGSARGFSVTKSVVCTGVGVPPPPQPDGVDIIFQ